MSYDRKWFSFWWGWDFTLTYSSAGYFDPRPELNIGLIFFHLLIRLPFKSKWTDECDPPQYGLKVHGNKIWIFRGGEGNMNGGNKWWTFTMPWDWTWVRTSALRQDGKWEHETRKHKDRRFYDAAKWDDVLWHETHPYTYILKSGKVQNRTAKICVREREWRWRWLKFSPVPSIKSRSIEVDFNDEVGERTGSWKGGTTGCSYELRDGETPLACLRRMEKERKFN